jgi:hypothetical protein
MKNQRYNLLTTLIVSALHPNEPFPVGTTWEPTNAIDIQEAEALCLAGYAKKIDGGASDKLQPTWLQKQDEAKRKAAEQEQSQDEEDPAPTITSDEDEELRAILLGNVEQVRAELDGLTAAQLLRLDELEGDKEQGGKARKGVHDAINEAYAALEQE